MTVAGWGRFPIVDAPLRHVRDPDEVRAALGTNTSLIARGNGRAYGDAALNRDLMVSMLRADRLIQWDPATGMLTCEAGLLLADLISFALPRGFFPPVTPGTKLVTIGGMIAADVHGKNHHHHGTIGRHVARFSLLTADGAIHQVTSASEPELFAATCGGMGLTGIILDVTLRLMPVETAAIRQETLRARDLAEAIELTEASAGWTYTVAWIDCVTGGRALGRSLIYRGEHATRDEAQGAGLVYAPRRPHRVPIDLPAAALNRWSVRAFNALYYRRGAPGTRLVDGDAYFYPLDALLDWNRIYGRGGFVQYQCAVPLEASRPALRLLLERIAASGSGSFLAVLKRLGPAGDGMLSFPLEGYTLALDFPATPAVFNLLLALDAIVADHGGRIYLAKDARAGAAMIRRFYPRLEAFRALRARIDPGRKFASLLSERLDL